MSDRNLEGLSERERECFTHLEEATRLGVNFSQYCRDRKVSMHQWTWVKRALIRKGVIGGRRRLTKAKSAGFAEVRIAAPAVSATACRIRHPSGWTIECAYFPDVAWMRSLLSGEAS